jgi:hypothetical protein
MASGKTSTLTFRIEPALKQALCSAADHEHRSIANMVEVMILDYCKRNGVKVEAPTADQVKAASSKTRTKLL